MSKEQNNAEYVEIDLIAMVKTINQYKRFIIAIIAIAVIGAWGVSEFLLTPMYTSQASIRLGEELGSYSSLSTTKERMSSLDYWQEINRNLELGLSDGELNSLSDRLEFIEIDDTMLELSYQGEEPELAQEIVDELVDLFIGASEKNYQERVARHLNRIETLEQEESQLAGEIVKLEEDIAALADSQLSTTEEMLARNDLKRQLARLEERRSNRINDIYNLEDRLAEYESAEVINQAIEPTSSSSPNKSLNLAIAFILALLVSLFVVFILEAVKGHNQQN